MRKQFLITLILFLTILGNVFAQQRTITGQITSVDDGSPLPGVSIMVSGTNVGTVTDTSGHYSLKAPAASKTLIFSLIGMKADTIDIGTSNVINVSMQTASEVLVEVVVTALGIKREKKALGYSMQELRGGDFTEAREVNVANSLKGKVAGVFVNSSSSGGAGGSSFVVIRGASSLTGDNKPLFVVDGVPIDNQTYGKPNGFDGYDYGDGISNINPDNIASMSVLKGPSAAALYGARGAHGVILITTKSGEKGKKGIGVEVNSNYTIETPSVHPTFQNVWGGGYDDNYDMFSKKTVNGQEVSVWPGWLIDNWGGKMDGRPIMYEYAPDWGVNPYSPQPVNNIEKFYRTGSTFTNTLAVTGGNDKSAVRLSVSDMQNKSIVPNSSLERQSISLKASSQVSAKLFVEAKVDYTKQTGNNRIQNGSTFSNVASSLKIIPRSVNLDWMKNYSKADGSMQNFKAGGPYNPYWITGKFKNNDTRDRVMGMVRVKYDITNWLSIQGRTGTDYFTEKQYAIVPIGTPGDYYYGQVRNTMRTVKEENSDVLLTATGKLSNSFSGTFSMGANRLSKENETVQVTGTNISVPDVYDIRYASIITPYNYKEKKQINSVYFTGQLGYKEYLFLDISGRNDWSSTLGLKNQSFFYPSVSTSFVFTDALNLNSNILSFGKLRASVAQAGNDASPYNTMAGYNYDDVSFGGLRMAAFEEGIPLLDLKNELTTSYELGADLRLFNSRLDIDFTYYTQSTKNQILPVEISRATGFATKMINAGEIRNHGFEVMFNYTLLNMRQFKWNASLNLSKNKSEVISLTPGVTSRQLYNMGGSNSIQAIVGEPYGSLYGYAKKRNEAGQIVVDEYGNAQKADKPSILGNIQPDMLGGLTNTFSYKGISLSALLDFRIGGKVFSSTKYDQMAKGTGKFTENRDPEHMIIDGVIEDPAGDIVVGGKTYRKNDKKLLAQAYYALQGPWGDILEPMVIGADYVTFREVSLGYTFPARLLQNTPIKSAKLSLVARNLFYLYRDPEFKTMGISPEAAFNTEAYAQGVEAVGLPATRSIGFNIFISF